MAAVHTPEVAAHESGAACESHVAKPSEAKTSVARLKMIVHSLQERLGDGFDTAELAAEVEAEFAMYAGSRVTQFVPILVERQVRARLSAGSNTVDVGLPEEGAASPQSQRRTR